jgi:ArsR family transcriptional regulator
LIYRQSIATGQRFGIRHLPNNSQQLDRPSNSVEWKDLSLARVSPRLSRSVSLTKSSLLGFLLAFLAFSNSYLNFRMAEAIALTPAQTVAGFHALSEPLRLQIIDALRTQELCVCDLCDVLDVSQSKLSFHLKALREAELVIARQEGRWIYYSLNTSQFALLEQFLADIRRCGQVRPGRPCA